MSEKEDVVSGGLNEDGLKLRIIILIVVGCHVYLVHVFLNI